MATQNWPLCTEKARDGAAKNLIHNYWPHIRFISLILSYPYLHYNFVNMFKILCIETCFSTNDFGSIEFYLKPLHDNNFKIYENVKRNFLTVLSLNVKPQGIIRTQIF